jgi:flagellar hook-associated protein 3 FlgL
MRITNAMLVNNMLNYINLNQMRMDKLQNQIASGKKITTPSDDPVVASRALRFRADVSEIGQFRRNTSDALSWVETTEDSLDKITEVTQRVRELMVQGANGALSESETKNMSSELKQLKGQLIQIGNTAYAGRYIFSGFSTDQKLFVDDENSPDFGVFQTSVDTIKDRINYEIGVGNSININVAGGDLFNNMGNAIGNRFAQGTGGGIYFPMTLEGGNNSFEISVNGEAPVFIELDEGAYGSMEDLVSQMQNKIDLEGLSVKVSNIGNKLQLKSTEISENSTIRVENGSLSLGFANGLMKYVDGTVAQKGGFIQDLDAIISLFENGDTSEIGLSIGKIDNQLENVLRIRSDLGARYNRLELTENRLSMDEVTFTRLLSLNEDADMAEVIMKLKNEENVYNASLAGGARIIQPTLLDFLR